MRLLRNADKGSHARDRHLHPPLRGARGLPGLAVCGALAALLLAPAPVRATSFSSVPCPLALVLALDVSSSVDEREYALQMKGLAAAFREETVQSAIMATGGILVTAFEWSGRDQHVTHADWRYLATRADIETFADLLARSRRQHTSYPTALGYALGHAAIRLSSAPRRCLRQVVDISGDGVNNEGFPPASAYRAFDYARITVNGLVVRGADPDPLPYYTREVIRGSGAFVEVAETYSDYARAMARKLLREISGAPLAGLERYRAGPHASMPVTR
uniref:DUF1194 domain-containing protein n=1 Tax=Stappia sp. TaxID=1870903 RepID=UPI003BAC79CE